MFGGAFDPPHPAHAALAAAAVDQLQLDSLHVVPTGHAWHKARPLSPAADRLAMVKLAFAGIPHIVHDERELHRPGPSYTADTLRELAAEHPGAELFLVMGEDQAASFAAWHAWEAVAAQATLAVAHRGPEDEDGFATLRALPGVRLRELRMPRMPDSATAIRNRLAAGEDITRLVAPEVASYIARKQLYRKT